MQDSSQIDLIADSAGRLFARHDPLAQADDIWPAPLWTEAEEAGFTLALLTEDQGGFGFSPAEALAPVRIAAAQAVPLPLGETVLANWLLAAAGLDPVEGPLGVSTDGRAVPFGRHLAGLVMLDADAATLTLSRPAAADWQHGSNIAGEPRDSLGALPADILASAPAPMAPATLHALLAALRSVQMAGAAGRVLDMTLHYAGEREQFGRALSRFQAIQHNCAIMASHVAAANVAADLAIASLPQALNAPEAFVTIAAAAKIRTGEAATQVAALSHQIHGAIGFSHEYALHPLTRRLWSWRDEDGTDAEWCRLLAARVTALPERGLWPFLTALHEEAA